MVDRRILFPFFIVLLALPFLPILPELKSHTMDYKDGASAAVCITFDWEDDYPHSIYVSDRPADLKGDLPEKTDRILELLEEYDARATFFVVGIMATEFKDSFKSIEAGGHEVASHGNYHKGYSQLAVEDPQKVPNFGELGYYEQVERIENAEVLLGMQPKGFRAPGLDFNNDTLLALETLGYAYDSSEQAQDKVKPYHPKVNGETLALLEIPVSGGSAYAWDLYGRKYDAPDPGEEWKQDFERTYSEGGVFVPLLHPAFIGKDSQLLATLEELLEYTSGRDVWRTTLGELAQWHTNREELEVEIINPNGFISVLEIKNENAEMEGLVVEIDGKARAIGSGVASSYDGVSTKITFPVLEKGKKWVVLVRV